MNEQEKEEIVNKQKCLLLQACTIIYFVRSNYYGSFVRYIQVNKSLFVVALYVSMFLVFPLLFFAFRFSIAFSFKRVLVK